MIASWNCHKSTYSRRWFRSRSRECILLQGLAHPQRLACWCTATIHISQRPYQLRQKGFSGTARIESNIRNGTLPETEDCHSGFRPTNQEPGLTSRSRTYSAEHLSVQPGYYIPTDFVVVMVGINLTCCVSFCIMNSKNSATVLWRNDKARPQMTKKLLAGQFVSCFRMGEDCRREFCSNSSIEPCLKRWEGIEAVEGPTRLPGETRRHCTCARVSSIMIRNTTASTQSESLL
ncbi:hypothetical protein CC86DRAFT_160157 [Ophiobolus disseminans]|uniref:Uncharacterized protein n=1 Tax=Ophiobolus disseminans TaxID=1469910 RepID=A0A6A7AC94_9PLEO|nr:hypothetical protein CC86DRAFT_160157 [Ophiobolus disseminans]